MWSEAFLLDQEII